MSKTTHPTRHWPIESLAFLLATLAAAALVPAGTNAVSLWQIVVLSVAVIALGLPHGALDPWIARRSGFLQSSWRFGGQYLGLVLLVIALWWRFPVASLGAFLLFSAWHFGQDWARLTPPWQRLWLGFGLLALPASAHPEQVQLIFTLITNSQGAALGQALSLAAWITTPGMLGIAIWLGWRNYWSAASEITALVVLAWLVPALVYFLVYFCFLHSPRHFRQSLQDMDKSLRHAALQSAALYTALTLAIALPFALYLLSINDPEQALVRLVFIGLAALTVPHMLLMSRAKSGPNPSA